MNLKKQLKKSVKAAECGELPNKELRVIGFPKEIRMTHEGEFIFPDSPGIRADLLYELRERRLALQRQCEIFESAEGALRDYFIETLPVSDASGLSGKRAQVKIESRPIPQVEDWTKLYAHIKKTGNFELLQRRVNESAVKERWEDRKQVPGVTTFIVKKVSVTKI